MNLSMELLRRWLVVVKRVSAIFTACLIVILVAVVISAAHVEYSDEVNIDGRPASTAALKSNKYTQEDDQDILISNPFVTIDGYQLVDENVNFVLYYKEADLSIRIIDKVTNYIWGSSLFTEYLDQDENGNYLYPELVDEGDNIISQPNKRRVNSPVTIYYYRTIDDFYEETIFSNSASTISSEIIEHGFQANLYFGESKIKLKLKVILTDDGVEVSIPYDEIEELGNVEPTNFRLKNINVYPYMGAIKRNRMESGYLLIPEGVGSLIRFNNSEGKGTYLGRFYGNDQGLSGSVSLSEIKNEEGVLIPEPTLTANMFGVVHGTNQNAMLTIIDSGASYASFTASFSSPERLQISSFQLSFNYRHNYSRKMNQSGTNIIKAVTEKAHNFDIKIKYLFLNNDQANYVGIANKYRRAYLEKTENDLLPAQDNISLHLDVLGAENKPGFFKDQVIKMTSLKELEEIINDLDLDLTISYHGFQNGGYTNTAPGKPTLAKILGSISDIEKLNELDKVKLYFAINYAQGFEHGSDYNYSHLAKKVNYELITNYNRNNYASYSALRPDYSLSKLNSDYEKYQAMGILNIALEVIGNEVFSSYSSGGLSREEAIKNYQEMIEVFDNTAVYNSYSYGWNADVIFNTQLYNSNSPIFDDTIPFIPIVLSGFSEIYGRHSNFFANSQNELLRLIEYNVWPSFYITYESSHKLLKTGSKNIYTSRYHDWKEVINWQYDYVNQALKYVTGAYIVERNYLALGVYQVKYSNNKVIYVNYSANNYTDGVIIVKANDYLVGDY